MSYATSAILAAKLSSDKNLSPETAWDAAVKNEFPASLSSQDKNCPKNAFLGLCEEGLVKGIPGGKYTKSVQNKLYAITAVEFLKEWRNSSLSPIDLWPAVLRKLNEDSEKHHNSQMNVVVALWNNGLINDSASKI